MLRNPWRQPWDLAGRLTFTQASLGRPGCFRTGTHVLLCVEMHRFQSLCVSGLSYHTHTHSTCTCDSHWAHMTECTYARIPHMPYAHTLTHTTDHVHMHTYHHTCIYTHSCTWQISLTHTHTPCAYMCTSHTRAHILEPAHTPKRASYNSHVRSQNIWQQTLKIKSNLYLVRKKCLRKHLAIFIQKLTIFPP